MSTLSERLEIAMNKEGIIAADLARACGVKPPSVSGWLSGKSKFLRGENLLLAAKALKVSQLWLATGRGPMELPENLEEQEFPRPASKDDYALIPQYSAKGACGNGHHNDHVEVVGGLAFKRDWISRMSLKEDSLCVIYAHGESMNPTINDGDVLLVNAEYGSLRSGKVYAIRSAAGELLVKRLGQDALGNWLICSDNPDKDTYPNARVTPSEIDEIQVIGQVVWKGGGL